MSTKIGRIVPSEKYVAVLKKLKLVTKVENDKCRLTRHETNAIKRRKTKKWKPGFRFSYSAFSVSVD